MKTLEIIGCLLAIMVAHAYDEFRAQQFSKNLNECSEEQNKTLIMKANFELFLCALKKDGRIIDHESIVSDEMHKFIMDVTPKKRIAQGSRNLYDICSLNAETLKYISSEKLTYILTCSLPIVLNAFIQWD